MQAASAHNPYAISFRAQPPKGLPRTVRCLARKQSGNGSLQRYLDWLRVCSPEPVLESLPCKVWFHHSVLGASKVVYTASALVEQTTPDAAELVDTVSAVEELAFLDEASACKG